MISKTIGDLEICPGDYPPKLSSNRQSWQLLPADKCRKSTRALVTRVALPMRLNRMATDGPMIRDSPYPRSELCPKCGSPNVRKTSATDFSKRPSLRRQLSILVLGIPIGFALTLFVDTRVAAIGCALAMLIGYGLWGRGRIPARVCRSCRERWLA